MPERARVVCLTGPRRFAGEFRAEWIRLATEGHTVVGTPDLGVADGPEAEALAAAHLRLIGMADEVRVVTDGTGYIGEGTAAEMEFAWRAGKALTVTHGVPLLMFARAVALLSLTCDADGCPNRGGPVDDCPVYRGDEERA